MNYPDYPLLPGSTPEPRRRKPNLFLLLLLGFMAFFLFSQFRKPNVVVRPGAGGGALPEQQIPGMPAPRDVTVPGGLPKISIPDISNDGAPRRAATTPEWAKRRQTQPSSDWAIDTGVSSGSGGQSVAGEGPTKTGDWSLDVGASKSGGATAVKSPPKETNKGDWSIGEVDTDKSP